MAKQPTRTRAPAPRTLPEVASLRTDQRERRQRIVDAAARLMVTTDYDRIQVKDVADHADVALGTLYRYFNSKDHLFACALQSWSVRFGDHLVLSPTGPTVDRVRAVYRLAVRAFEKQPRVYNVTMQVQSSTDPHATDVFGAFGDQQMDAFGVALETSNLPDAERQDITDVMSAVLDTNLRSWQLGHQPIAAVYDAIDRAARLIISS
jgi:AcrR family transcriptional regulator